MSPPAAAQSALDPSLLNPTPEGDTKKPAPFGTWRKTEDRDTSRFQLGAQLGPAAGTTGFDSRNLSKRTSKSAQTNKANGVISAKPAEATADIGAAGTTQDATAQPPPSPKLLQPGTAPVSGQARNPFRPGAPPATPDAEIPTIASIPPRWRPVPEEKPFDPLGVQAGAFNFRPALDFVRGYDTNPGRFGVRPYASSWFDIYAPSLLVKTNWARHEFNADLRGAYTSYDTYHSLDRPSVIGNMNGRIDVTSLSHLDLQGRLLLGTDRPGSPFIQADLARLPIFTTLGGRRIRSALQSI